MRHCMLWQQQSKKTRLNITTSKSISEPRILPKINKKSFPSDKRVCSSQELENPEHM